MEEVPVELARWAVTDGLPVIAEAVAALDAGDGALVIGTRLRAAHDAARSAFALQAAEARLRLRAAGVEGADDLVVTREGAEQASHPDVARWRAARAAAARQRAGGAAPLQDRCAGTGADSVAMARHAPVIAVERDPGRAVLAEHRAAVLGRNVTVVVADALSTDEVPVAGAVVHADPDRRDAQGRRARTLAGHGPSVPALREALAGAAGTMLTVAPGVDLADPDLPADAELVFVQHERRLVEAVLCTGAAREDDVAARAVLLPEGLERSRSADAEVVAVGDVGRWLVVPAVAAVRARLHDGLAHELGGRRLARRRALLTTDDEPPSSPWYEAERVEAVLPPRGRALRRHLAGRDHAVEVVLHGLDVPIASYLREAGRPRTGPADLRVHLVRRDDDAIAIVTHAAR